MRFDSFEQRVNKKLKGVQSSNLVAIHEELVTLGDAIEDMVI